MAHRSCNRWTRSYGNRRTRRSAGHARAPAGVRTRLLLTAETVRMKARAKSALKNIVGQPTIWLVLNHTGAVDTRARLMQSIFGDRRPLRMPQAPDVEPRAPRFRHQS